jgi:hypothetical protein
MGSGQNIYLPTQSPCESSPKPSLGNCAKNVCLVVYIDILFNMLIVIKKIECLTLHNHVKNLHVQN